MATIVLLEHALQGALSHPYMAHALARRWEARGHRVLYHRGAGEPPAADLALLHVDCTVVPEAYRALVARYPRVINGAVFDISKRHVSRNIVAPGERWPGPVMVKSDLNFGGNPEVSLLQAAARAGVDAGIPPARVVDRYALHPSSDAVPAEVWSDPARVVEKYLPERDERGYALRVWTFFGDRERSSRVVSTSPLVKAANVVERHVVEVPEAMREERRRLGFDFGKFDYVLHGGKFHLLDANRTPTAPPGLAAMEASLDDLALGLDAFL